MHPISRTICLTIAVLFAVVGAPAAAQELPPEIRMDRYMVQVDRQIRNEQFAAALRTLDLIVELQEAHDLALPESFWMKRAVVAIGAGNYAEAIASATRYPGDRGPRVRAIHGGLGAIGPDRRGGMHA